MLWENYINHSDFRMYSESVIYKSVNYYAGLIMHKDNPYYDDVVEAFHRIAEMLPPLMVRPKAE